MRTLLIVMLVAGALIWAYSAWGPQPAEMAVVWVECNGQLFGMPKPAQGSYICENNQPKLVGGIPATPAPTSSNNAAPTLQPTVIAQPTASQPAANSCPTTAEVKKLTGVDVQRLGTEKCAWVWRAVDQATTTAICPSGWVCTWDVVGDIVVVHLGVTQTATIRAGTWRFIDGYPATDAVHNVCELYRNERDFGLSEVPPFKVRFQAAYDGSGALVGPATCP